jgi:hypothetical protein
MKKNIQLVYTGKVKKVRTAVEKTNEILSSREFYSQIRAYRRFDNSALSPDVIAKLMEESGHVIKIKTSWFMPDSASTTHNTIKVCTWNFSTNLALGVNTLIYETVNSIDCLYDILYNEKHRQGDSMTAPWVIGAIAEVMVR